MAAPAPLPLSETVLFGDSRRAPSSSQRGAPRALAPRLLESELGRAWGPGQRDGAEAQLRRLEAERREAEASRLAENNENRKRNREAREAGQVCNGCAPGLLQDYRELLTEAVKAHGTVSNKLSGMLQALLSKHAGKESECSSNPACDEAGPSGA